MQEGKVVVGLAVAAGGDAALGFQPGVGALDRPAVACLRIRGAQAAASPTPDFAGRGARGDWLAAGARLADPRLDLTIAQGLLKGLRGVPAIGPQLLRTDAAPDESVDERQQMSALVLVA